MRNSDNKDLGLDFGMIPLAFNTSGQVLVLERKFWSLKGIDWVLNFRLYFDCGLFSGFLDYWQVSLRPLQERAWI